MGKVNYWLKYQKIKNLTYILLNNKHGIFLKKCLICFNVVRLMGCQHSRLVLGWNFISFLKTILSPKFSPIFWAIKFLLILKKYLIHKKRFVPDYEILDLGFNKHKIDGCKIFILRNFEV